MYLINWGVDKDHVGKENLGNIWIVISYFKSCLVVQILILDVMLQMKGLQIDISEVKFLKIDEIVKKDLIHKF